MPNGVFHYGISTSMPERTVKPFHQAILSRLSRLDKFSFNLIAEHHSTLAYQCVIPERCEVYFSENLIILAIMPEYFSRKCLYSGTVFVYIIWKKKVIYLLLNIPNMIMKLLLIYLVLCFIFLITGSGILKGVAKEEIRVCRVAAGECPGVGSSELSAGIDCLNVSELLREIDIPVKNLDLPGDHGNGWNTLAARVLPFIQYRGINRRVLLHSSSEYMRFLSARHANGFYIYFLRKLII